MFKNDRLRKFEEIPWDKVDLGPRGGWSYGRGGAPLTDEQWHLDHTHADLSQDVYPFPKVLNDILKQQFQHGKDEKLQEIRNALEI